MVKFYALSDCKDKSNGAFEISYSEAQELNKQGYGIFICPNDFKGARRKANLLRINFWIADIDEGTKQDMQFLISSLVLKPSIIIETKRGYHLYWRAINATPANYEAIERGLIKRLNADEGAKDYTRLLRCPNFYHMKDPNNPYLIKVVQQNENAYTEEQMLFCYGIKKKNLRPLQAIRKPEKFRDVQEVLTFFKAQSLHKGNRHNYLVNKIGYMKRLEFDYIERENLINIINQNFIEPLPQEEVDTILRTTK